MFPISGMSSTWETSAKDLRELVVTPMGQTLAEKVWQAHVVRQGSGAEPDLLYIDLHLVHEVTSPQAFDGLRLAGRPVRRPDLTIATEDHNVPTLGIELPIADPVRSEEHTSELQS